MSYHCIMKLNRITTHLIILLAAIILAILFDSKALSWFWEVKFDGNWDSIYKKWGEVANLKIRALLWNSILFVISFYILVIANLMLNTRRILFVILVNITLYSIIALVGSWWVENTFKPVSFEIDGLINVRYILVLILALSFAYLMILLDKYRQAGLTNIRLQEEKTKAEVTALKDQLSPHFFFNTLNSLSALIRKDQQKESLEFVENLSDIYRYTLDKGNQDFVTVQEELDFITSYFELVSKRFGNAIMIDIDLSNEIRDCQIPTMALQILIENVLKHNQLSESKPVKVQIHSEESILVVKNNCRPKEVQDSNGLGLANLNKRCQMLIGKDILIQQKEDDFIVKLPMLKS
jgi:two-component system, LytTR family, sensor kinase